MKSNTSLRVVVDTNVLVSAIVFGGKPRQVIDLIADRTLTVVIAQELVTELRRKILNKFPAFREDLARVEKLLERDSLWIKLGSMHITVCRDSDDNKFIETALLGQCRYIVSGDNDLLDLKSYQDIEIIKPAEFLQLYS